MRLAEDVVACGVLYCRDHPFGHVHMLVADEAQEGVLRAGGEGDDTRWEMSWKRSTMGGTRAVVPSSSKSKS